MSGAPPPLPKKPRKLFKPAPTGYGGVDLTAPPSVSPVAAPMHARSMSSIPDTQRGDLVCSAPTAIGNCIRVTKYDNDDSTDFESFLSYTVEVTMEDGKTKHIARKRFSEFVQFHGSWTKIYKGIKHIGRPKKKMFVRSNDKELRRMELQIYIRSVCRIAALRYELADFLVLEPKKLQAALAPSMATRKAGWGQETGRGQAAGHTTQSSSTIRTTQSSNAIRATQSYGGTSNRPVSRAAPAIPSRASLARPVSRAAPAIPSRASLAWPAARAALAIPAKVPSARARAPVRLPSPARAPSPPPAPAKSAWEEYEDAGDPYWHNPETGETTWERPAELDAPPARTMTRVASQNSILRRRSRESSAAAPDGHLHSRGSSRQPATAAASTASGRRRSKDIGGQAMTLQEAQDSKGQAGFDVATLEQCLSPAAFRDAFSMEPAEFERLPGWKRANLKKGVGLF